MLALGLASMAAAQLPKTASAHHSKKWSKSFKLAEKFKPQMVLFPGYKPGTIVVDPKNHYLYLVESRFRARRYGVGVEITARDRGGGREGGREGGERRGGEEEEGRRRERKKEGTAREEEKEREG